MVKNTLPKKKKIDILRVSLNFNIWMAECVRCGTGVPPSKMTLKDEFHAHIPVKETDRMLLALKNGLFRIMALQPC